MEITYNSLKQIVEPYDLKKMRSSLIICNSAGATDALKEKHKVKIFLMLGRTVVKNIHNFYYMTRYIKNENLVNEDELVGEAFLVLDTCISKCRIDLLDSFLFYYNTSLSRRFVRIKNDFYKLNGIVSYISDIFQATEENEKMILEDNLRVDKDDTTADENILKGQLMSKWGLTPIEIMIVLSRLKGERVVDFLDKFKKVTQNDYYSHLNSIKQKLSFLKDSGDIKIFEDE